MELITYYLNQGLSFVIPLVILLGILVFVHELGHFLVAKYYGVRVEVFSLGFGKKFFSFRRGETEYCLSIVPLGGYVKMYGDDPTAEIPTENRNVSFTHKPVGQRIAIVLAGPLMNLLFAFILFVAIAFVGEEVVRPVIGDISPNSKAFEFGLRPQDEVVAVNNQKIADWNQLREAIEGNSEGPIQISVRHFGDSEVSNIQARTSLGLNPNVLSSEIQVGEIEGLTFGFRSSQVAVAQANTAAAQVGIQTGDRISSVNGVAVERWLDLKAQILAAHASGTIQLEFERLGEREKIEKKSATVFPHPAIKGEAQLSTGDAILTAIGLEEPDLYIANVIPDSAAATAGLKKGDKVVAINGPITEWQQLVKKVQAFEESQPALKVGVLRDGKPLEFEVRPKKISQQSPTGKEKEVFALGVMAGLSTAPALTTLERTNHPWVGLTKGLKETTLWTKNTVLSFLRLLQNRVSAKSIGGPIMIGQLASKTFEIGISPFLKIMAIISINLFVLNLLPVPVLDGGHLVFFTIEALRGAPLSMRKMEIAQQVGLVILGSLMFLALFNDVSRLFN